MILVTLGTQDKEFTRLIKKIDELIEKKIIKEEVIVQAGCTKYRSDNFKVLDLLPQEEFDALVENCSVLITHGGVGSILTGLKKNKTIIAVPRLKKYDEHESDHQIEIVDEFTKRGYIIGIKDVDELEHALKKSRIFKPATFESNTNNMINIIEEYISLEEKQSNKINITKPLIILLIPLLLSIILRIVLELTILNGKGDELLSLIITWIIITILNYYVSNNKERLFKYLNNNITSLIIQFILVFIFIVMLNIKSIILKIILYIIIYTISNILNYITNIMFREGNF